MTRKDQAGDAAHLDEPAPPGSPLRGDEADGGESPGTPGLDPGPEVERVTKRADAPVAPPEPVATRPEQTEADAERQRANAEAADAGEPSQ